VLILANHVGGYTSVLEAPAAAFLAELGLSTFVFLSGYALTLRYKTIQSAEDMRRFLWKRVRKIYPLYLPALAVFVVLFHYWSIWGQWDIAPVVPTVIAHVFSGQILLSPWITPVHTLWFVGCIMPYYLVYVVLAKYGRTPKRMVAVAVLVFAFYVGFKAVTGLVEYRFFYYYPLFVGGAVAGCLRTSHGPLPRRRIIAGAFGGAIAMVIMATYLWEMQSTLHDQEGGSLRSFLVMEGVCFLFSVAAVLTIVCVSRILAPHLSRRATVWVTCISMASYATYLFHRPILALLAAGLRDGLGTPAVPSDMIIVGVGLPLVFVVGYHLQHLSDAVSRLSRR
jgi:peptidoglycan/LPS O-acetylase OafA/YrhL